jgi:hypothetical protein
MTCHACGGSGRKKEKDQLQNFASLEWRKKQRTQCVHSMAMILMATSSSLGAYLPLPQLTAYPKRPFNGYHSLGNVEFPRHVFHVAWPASVPKAFKNIGKAIVTMVIN